MNPHHIEINFRQNVTFLIKTRIISTPIHTDMKEPRVYVVSADHANDLNGFAIDSWVDHEEEYHELSEEAKEFVEEAEKNGNVYSLKGYMVAHNINEEVGMNDYVFITSAY